MWTIDRFIYLLEKVLLIIVQGLILALILRDTCSNAEEATASYTGQYQIIIRSFNEWCTLSEPTVLGKYVFPELE